MLKPAIKRRIIGVMNTVPNINKKAFIAAINNRRKQAAARREVVDTVYKTNNGKTELILIFETGEKEKFTGMKAA